MSAKKIPYGLTDFARIITENYYYVDKTKFIENIENAPNFLFLIRPRRFGKSLWLSTMSAYYDINLKDRFNEFFGNLYIGKNPTGNQNKYLILNFNFSNVNSNIDELKSSFESHCDTQIFSFVSRYKHLFKYDIEAKLAEKKTAAAKLDLLSFLASENNLPIYLIIDEYDNFANTILSSPLNGRERYKALTHGEGFFRFFFNVIKGATTGNFAGIKKIFITGVSPLAMDDVTSGFNIGTNITIHPKFNSMVGFTKDEVLEMLNYYKGEGFISENVDNVFEIMKKWYDNYCFSTTCIGQKMFNTDMTLYFMMSFINDGKAPDVLVDSNIKVDYGKLRYMIVLDKQLNGNFSKIKEIAEKGEIISPINTRFSIDDLIKSDNFVSLLFYFGILTIDRVEYDQPVMKVPNLTTQQMLLSYIVDSYEDTDIFKANTDILGKKMFEMSYKGEWKPWFDYMAKLIEEQTTIRDYIEGEKAVQTLHLAYMSLFNYYIVKPEYELNFGFCDVMLEANLTSFPSMKYSYIIEFKYIPRGEKVDLDAVAKSSKEQLLRYAKSHKITDKTALKLVYVVYHGWEMVDCEEI